MPTAAETATATAAGEVASVARLIAAAGLVEAFGHVSARRAGGGFTITSTAPLGCADAAGMLACDETGAALGGGEGLPLEAPLHAAIYAARSDVGAICRTHSPAAVTVGADGDALPVAHGLGGLAGRVAFFPDPGLVTDGDRAAAAAAALGLDDCLLIRGNGAVATGSGLAEAAVRAWFLEERARVQLGGATELSPAELAERQRHYGAETERAWRWLCWQFGEGER